MARTSKILPARFHERTASSLQDKTEIFLAGYYGHDWRFVANPLCINPMTETTLMYWDPDMEWYQAFKPEAKFKLKHFARVPAGLGQDYNAVLAAIK